MTDSAKRLKTLLVVSLLANIFLVGGVIGGLYQWSSHARAPAPVVQHGLRQALIQLPDARRLQLRSMLRDTRRENQALILASREAHQDVVRRLRASDFNRDALDQDLDRARTADITLRTRVDATLANFAASLPPDERQILAEAMTTRHHTQEPAMQKK